MGYNIHMKDAVKCRVLTVCMAVLCVLAVAYAAVEEFVLPDVQQYLQRKLYYEQTLKDKGLSMEPARHWRKAD